MRAISLLLVTAALLAGCASNAPTDTASTSTPSDTTTPSSGAEATFLGAHFEHNFSGPEESKTFEVPSGAGPLALDMYYTGAGTGPGTVCVTQQSSADILVLTPTGSTGFEKKYDGSGVVGANSDGHCSSDRVEKRITLAPGTWTVKFTGSAQGVLVGVFDLKKA